MAIMPERVRFIGSVSSGCLDVEVVEAARAALRRGSTQHLRFGPDGSPPWSDGLSCGGWMAVRVEPWWGSRHGDVASAVRRWLENDEAGIVVSNETQHVAIDEDGGVVGDAAGFPQSVLAAALGRLRDELPPTEVPTEGPDLEAGPPAANEAGRTKDPARREPLFLRTIRRRARLLIIGAVDVAVHLVVLARDGGFATHVIDPREAFTVPDRFPVRPDGIERGWPQERIPGFKLGPRDAAVVLTHDPKIDDVALEALLQTRAGYVGALGSTRSHAARLDRLRGRGADEPSLARIRGPAGIHLGTPHAAGIALGIAAGVAAWQAKQETSLLS